MTDVIIRSPDDTGDIPRPVGENLTVILRADDSEKTQRIDPRVIQAPSFDAIPRRVFDIDDTVTYMPATIGLAGPQSPPPPLPKPPPTTYDMAATVDGWLVPAGEVTERLVLPRSVTGLDDELRPDGYFGRHRDPQDRIAVAGQRQWELIAEAAKPQSEPRRWRVLVGVGAFIALTFGVSFAVLAVFW